MPLKGYKITEEHRKNLSISHRGYKWTKEQRKNASISKMGHFVSEETKQKNTGENSATWKGGKPKCIDCGKQLSAYSSKRCHSCAKKGELNYNWILDRNKLIKKQERNDYAYVEWRKEVWKRDNWKCKISNQDCDGRIESHHILSWIDYPELRYNINNGITLCHAHHPRKRAEEKTLIPVFQELVPVS